MRHDERRMLHRIAKGMRITYHKRCTSLDKLIKRGYLAPAVRGEVMRITKRGLAWLRSGANMANGT